MSAVACRRLFAALPFSARHACKKIKQAGSAHLDSQVDAILPILQEYFPEIAHISLPRTHSVMDHCLSWLQDASTGQLPFTKLNTIAMAPWSPNLAAGHWARVKVTLFLALARARLLASKGQGATVMPLAKVVVLVEEGCEEELEELRRLVPIVKVY